MLSYSCYAFFVLAGSNHTILGSYWSEKLGKKKMLGTYLNLLRLLLMCHLSDDNRRCVPLLSIINLLIVSVQLTSAPVVVASWNLN